MASELKTYLSDCIGLDHPNAESKFLDPLFWIFFFCRAKIKENGLLRQEMLSENAIYSVLCEPEQLYFLFVNLDLLIEIYVGCIVNGEGERLLSCLLFISVFSYTFVFGEGGGGWIGI